MTTSRLKSAKIFIFCILFFPMSLLVAAGSITHLYLAERYLEAFNVVDEKNAEDFLIGTLFPDIRYIAQCPRELTHFIVTDLNEVHAESNYFYAGMKFHAWVDYTREQFVCASGIYEKVIPHAFGREATLLKFIEEEILISLYDGTKWSPMLDKIIEEEKSFGIPENLITRWHMMNQYVLSYKISWLIWGVSFFKDAAFGISSSNLNSWSYLLPQLSEDPMFQTYMQQMLEHICQKLNGFDHP